MITRGDLGIIFVHSAYIYLINPVVSVEANVETDSEVKTGIPVDEDQDVEYNLEDPEGIWDTGGRLSFVKELEHSLYFRDSVEPHNDIARDLIITFAREQKVEEICRKNTEQVLFEPVRFPIGSPQ